MSPRGGLRRSWSLCIVLATAACSHRAAIPPYPLWPNTDVQPSEACSDSAPHLLPPSRVSDTLSLAAARGRDQRDAWLARHVLGGWAWGPWPTSARGVGVMWMRDATQKRAVLAALDSLSLPDASYARGAIPDSVVALDIRWDAAELYDWMAYLLYSRNHPPLRGVTINAWGVDTRRGRVMLGFEHAESIPTVAAWLRELGAPCNLVIAVQTGPIRVSGTVTTAFQ